MNQDTIRRLYQIGIIVAAVLFVAMLIDHFANAAALLVPLAIVFALVAAWLIVMLFLTPTEDTVQEEAPEPEAWNMDYPGDVHAVEDLEGVGPVYADRLHDMGVYNTQELLFTDDEKLRKTVGVPAKTVTSWKAMSQLIKVKGIGPQYAEALVRGGVEGIEDLAQADVEPLTRSVNAYLESLDSTVVGQSISEKRVTKWKRAASRMRKEPIDLESIDVRPLESKAARADAATG